MFNSFFDDMVARDLFMKGLPTGDQSIRPASNVKETETGFEIELAIPGFNKSEINIELKGNTLVLSGKKESAQEDNEGKYTFREFSNESFSRSFTLPKNIRTAEITAQQVNGILVVNLPKEAPVEALVKKIEVV